MRTPFKRYKGSLHKQKRPQRLRRSTGAQIYNEPYNTMNNDKKKCTFEDWLNGDAFNKPNNKQNGLDLAHMHGTDQISENDYKEIINKQEQAYDRLIEYHVSAKKKDIRSKINTAPNPSVFIEEESKEISQRLEPYKKALALGRKSFHLITGPMYKKIMDENKCWVLFENSSADNESRKADKLYKAWIDHHVLTFLKELKAEVDESTDNEDPTPLQRLDPKQRDKIERSTIGKDEKGSSKYSLDEYQMYLAVHLLNKNRSRRWKAERAAEYLEGEAKKRMEYLSENTTRFMDWESWLK